MYAIIDWHVLNYNPNDDIKEAFQPFYECTLLQGETDINYVYDTFKDCGSFYQKFYSKDGKSRGYGLLKFSDENIGLSAINKMYNLLIGEKRISLIVKNKSNFF